MGDLTLLLVIFIGVSILLYFIRFKGWWVVLIAGVIIFFILRWASGRNSFEFGDSNDEVVQNFKNLFNGSEIGKKLLNPL